MISSTWALQQFIKPTQRIGARAFKSSVAPASFVIPGVMLSNRLFFLVMVVGVQFAGAGLGGIHQSVADRQFRRSIFFTNLIDKLNQFLANLHVVRQDGAGFTGKRG